MHAPLSEVRLRTDKLKMSAQRTRSVNTMTAESEIVKDRGEAMNEMHTPLQNRTYVNILRWIKRPERVKPASENFVTAQGYRSRLALIQRH